jgi:protocatechuate 3,4-dioxygenase beta subunit
MTQDQQPVHERDLTRRGVLVAGGATAAAVGLGGALAADAFADDASGSASPSSDPSASPTGAETCYELTSETTEGPYYIDADKIRQDVTEDEEGIPLTLKLKVIDADTCKPLKNAAIDIWQCTAMGVYSGYESVGNGDDGGTPTAPPTGTPSPRPTDGTGGGGGGGGHVEPTDDERYLRGTWKTDRSGYVTFKSIFPGWYQGRCVHIHVKVHVDGEWTSAGYEGGHTCHTGQLFFSVESVLAAAAIAPYSTNTVTRTTLTQDRIYPQNGHEGGLLYLKYNENKIAKGVQANLTLGVVPEETDAGPAPQPSTSPSSSAD